MVFTVIQDRKISKVMEVTQDRKFPQATTTVLKVTHHQTRATYEHMFFFIEFLFWERQLIDILASWQLPVGIKILLYMHPLTILV